MALSGKPGQSERIVTQARNLFRRHRGCQLFARGGENLGEFVRRKPVLELPKNVGRLIEPEIGHEFGGLFRMFQPGPGSHMTLHHQRLGMRAQMGGNCASGVFGPFRTRRFESHA